MRKRFVNMLTRHHCAEVRVDLVEIIFRNMDDHNWHQELPRRKPKDKLAVFFVDMIRLEVTKRIHCVVYGDVFMRKATQRVLGTAMIEKDYHHCSEAKDGRKEDIIKKEGNDDARTRNNAQHPVPVC